MTIVELAGWGPAVSAAVARLEQAFFVLIVIALLILFTVTFMAVAGSFRR